MSNDSEKGPFRTSPFGDMWADQAEARAIPIISTMRAERDAALVLLGSAMTLLREFATQDPYAMGRAMCPCGAARGGTHRPESCRWMQARKLCGIQ